MSESPLGTETHREEDRDRSSLEDDCAAEKTTTAEEGQPVDTTTLPAHRHVRRRASRASAGAASGASAAERRERVLDREPRALVAEVRVPNLGVFGQRRRP